MLDSLTPSEDYFDVAEGLYWFCSDYHEGQFSLLYSIMSARLGFCPSPHDHGCEEGSLAFYVYEALADGAIDPEDALHFVNVGYGKGSY